MRQVSLASSKPQVVTILSGAALSDGVVFGTYSKGVIHMPAAWTAADIGFYVSSEADGIFQPLYDGANPVVIASPDADRVFPLPAALAGALYFMLWSNTAGADTNQGADRSITVELKA
jgi:hypothetical protein